MLTHRKLIYWTKLLHKKDEKGFVFLDVLTAAVIVMILNGFLWPLLQSSWHLYDHSSNQMEATGQVSIFLQQWRKDIEESSHIAIVADGLHVVLPSGRTIDYLYNGAPAALHIYRLVNGSGGEVACIDVTKCTFQLDNPKSVRLIIDVANSGANIHYEAFASSFVSL